MTMSEEPKHVSNSFATFLGAIAGLLLMWWLIGASRSDGETTVGAGRGEERRAALEELRESSAETLASYDKLNEANGVYQIPLDRALEIVEQEWSDAGEGRKKLLARAAKAFAPPPASAATPTVESEYE